MSNELSILRTIRGYGNARIPPTDIPLIKARVKAGEAKSAIAREYGVSRFAISALSRGRTWRFLDEDAA